jgi:hypothetical protein
MRRERRMKVVATEAEEKSEVESESCMLTYYRWAGGEGRPAVTTFGHCFKVPHCPSKPAFCSFAGESYGELSPCSFSKVIILFSQRVELPQSIIYISKYGIGR